MKRKELTKTFMMISNGIKHGLHGLYKKYSSVVSVNPFKSKFTIVFVHHNFRLVVDEDDLMWFKILKKITSYIGKPVSSKFSFSNPWL